MQKHLIPFAKALGTASLLSVSLAACVGGGNTSSSSEAAVSSETATSSVSSAIESSSSTAPSSSSVASSSSEIVIESSSSVMSSSSEAVVSSSSEAAADCSSLVAQGDDIYNKAGLNCSTCHGAANGPMTSGTYMIDILGGFYESDDGSSPELDTFIATYMTDTLPKVDVAGEAEAVAAYLYDAAGANWCEGSTGSSSSAPVSSSSEVASSSSAPAGNDDVVVLYAVNAGGTMDVMSADGIDFVRDYYVSGGNLGSTEQTITNTQDQELFQAERWGDFTYDFPVKEGTYDVTFYVAETWFGNGNEGGQGMRVFDISAEGNTIVSNFNPLDVVAPREAHTFESKGIQVDDGSLTLTFEASVDAASIRAIVVRGLDGNKGEPPAVDEGTVGTAPLPTDCAGEGTVGENDL
ncbi:MAG TPA: malectin domain-containing carbohydrate-binding protein [Marinagarivorans sp.]